MRRKGIKGTGDGRPSKGLSRMISMKGHESKCNWCGAPIVFLKKRKVDGLLKLGAYEGDCVTRHFCRRRPRVGHIAHDCAIKSSHEGKTVPTKTLKELFAKKDGT